MNREPIQIDEAGGIDVSRLSEQVSAACDRWLRAHGLQVEKGTFGRTLQREVVRGETSKAAKGTETRSACP
jgi:hypothetical protein